MNIIIFGASGKTGDQIVRQSLDRGHTVTAYVRHLDRLTISDANLTVAVGAITDRAAISDAMKGQDAVLSALGAPMIGQDPLSGKPVTVYTDSIGPILSAMSTHGVRRILVITAAAANPKQDPNNPFFIEYIITPLFLKPIFDNMRQMEATLIASDTDWTIVRPAQLLGGSARGDYRVASGYTLTEGRQLTRADLASFMLDQLEQDDYVRQGVAIAY